MAGDLSELAGLHAGDHLLEGDIGWWRGHHSGLWLAWFEYSCFQVSALLAVHLADVLLRHVAAFDNSFPGRKHHFSWCDRGTMLGSHVNLVVANEKLIQSTEAQIDAQQRPFIEASVIVREWEQAFSN